MKTGPNPKFSGIKIKSFHCSLPNEFSAVMEGRHSALGCLGEIKVAEHWNNNSKRCERKKQTNMTCLNSQVKTAAPHFGGTWYSFTTIRNSFVMLGLPCLDNTHIYYLNTNTLPHCSFWFWFFPFISHNRDLFCVTIMTCHGNMLFHQACFFPLIFFPLKGQYVEFFLLKTLSHQQDVNN